MTSDRQARPPGLDGARPPSLDGARPPGDIPDFVEGEWLGDVSVGVDAWTRRGGGEGRTPPPPEARPEEPGDEASRSDAEAFARKILLDQLTGQARSRKELAERLAKKNVPDDLAARLLDRFEEVGLIDDAAFARAWVASRGRSEGRALARRALAQELRRKGVADEVAREALDEIDPVEEEAAARALVRRKLRSMGSLAPEVRTRRLLGMLARKGYPGSLAMAAIRSEMADVPESEV